MSKIKKLITFLLASLIFAALAISVCAGDVPRLVDNADVIPDDEEAALLAYLDEQSAALNFDFVAVIEDSIGGGDVVSYADDWFDENGFGAGADYDGILLLIVMDTREWAFSTCGFGITVFGDSELYALEDAMVDELSGGNYGQGVYNYAQIAVRYVDFARQYGYDYSYDGYYAYDNDWNEYFGWQTQTTVNRASVLGRRALTCGIIGLITAALIVLLGMRSKMSNIHKKGAAGDYIRRDSLRIHRANEKLLNKTVSRRERDVYRSSGGGSSHHGGGGFHSSSSGRSHGGSHGRF